MKLHLHLERIRIIKTYNTSVADTHADPALAIDKNPSTAEISKDIRNHLRYI